MGEVPQFEVKIQGRRLSSLLDEKWFCELAYHCPELKTLLVQGVLTGMIGQYPIKFFMRHVSSHSAEIEKCQSFLRSLGYEVQIDS